MTIKTLMNTLIDHVPNTTVYSGPLIPILYFGRGLDDVFTSELKLLFHSTLSSEGTKELIIELFEHSDCNIKEVDDKLIFDLGDGHKLTICFERHKFGFVTMSDTLPGFSKQIVLPHFEFMLAYIFEMILHEPAYIPLFMATIAEEMLKDPDRNGYDIIASLQVWVSQGICEPEYNWAHLKTVYNSIEENWSIEFDKAKEVFIKTMHEINERCSDRFEVLLREDAERYVHI